MGVGKAGNWERKIRYKQFGELLVILPGGGDKQTQTKDIKTALRLARNLWRCVMVKTKATKYDVSEHLRTTEEMAAYLEACIEEANGDAAFIAKALGDIARAKGMSQVARDSGLSRESLYKALSRERSPGFDTVLKVMGALGIGLRAEVAHAKAQRDVLPDQRKKVPPPGELAVSAAPRATNAE